MSSHAQQPCYVQKPTLPGIPLHPVALKEVFLPPIPWCSLSLGHGVWNRCFNYSWILLSLRLRFLNYWINYWICSKGIFFFAGESFSVEWCPIPNASLYILLSLKASPYTVELQLNYYNLILEVVLSQSQKSQCSLYLIHCNQLNCLHSTYFLSMSHSVLWL